jgi:hypothetical protein
MKGLYPKPTIFSQIRTIFREGSRQRGKIKKSDEILMISIEDPGNREGNTIYKQIMTVVLLNKYD